MAQTNIHTYRAAEAGLNVNAYLVETEEGVVVVDTTCLVSDAAALRARLVALKKPLQAVFLTHAHPDHFNGVIELVRDREVPVYAAESVASTIEEIADDKRAQWAPVFGEEWPTETYYPNTRLFDNQTVEVGGLSIRVTELGANESHADSYLELPGDNGRPTVFIGDLFFNGMYSYTADGHTGRWLRTLDRLSESFSELVVLYPGHGSPASPRIFADQRRYLLYYREVVRRLAAGERTLSEPGRSELESSMRAFLPGASLTWMIGLGADPVAAELAG